MMNNLYERLHNINTQIKELYRERELVQRQIDMESQYTINSKDYAYEFGMLPQDSKKLSEDWDKVLEDSGRLFK